MTHHHPRITKFLLILLASFNTAWALDSDQYQPLHVTAASAVYDREQHTITYEGHVQAIQGTANLDGDKVVVYQTANNKIKQMVVWGKPAHYSTIPSANKSRLYVEALQITYNPNDKTVLLEGNGRVKQDEDLFTGPYIWYDMTRGIVRSKTNKASERTVVIIQPQAKQK